MASMHIILYTDNPAMVKMGSEAFGSADERLTVCESGMELLAAVRALAADVVILDLAVHGLGGLLLASAIEELAPDLPIVAVTVRQDLSARPVLQRGIPCAVLDPGANGTASGHLRKLVTAGRQGLAASGVKAH
jgi:CheY-like chemotaxis protein